MYAVILGFVSAFALTFSIIPVIIRVAKERRLLDNPNERSAHREPTPSLGGIAIFAGMICSVVLWTPLQSFGVMQYTLAAFVIIFMIGVVDDLLALTPSRKIAGQVLVAVILVYKANIRLTNGYGIMGIHELTEIPSFILSVVMIIAIINAFNLIDGINGLAGAVGLVASITWGGWFLAVGSMDMAMLAFSLAGAIVAFLKYNFTPAKIFMGDTGSLLIGTICAIMAIRFIEINMNHVPVEAYAFRAAPAIATGILILPLFDAFRVLIRRIVSGKSPFLPDRSHIHHLLLDFGLSHMQATATLTVVNLAFIGLVFSLNHLGTIYLLLLELCLAAILTLTLERSIKPKH